MTSRDAILERIASNVLVDSETDCWLWQGTLTRDGYGRISVDGRKTVVHRVALAAWNDEPIPPGMHVDHRCARRSCCNPLHLEVVTAAENTRRSSVYCPETCRSGRHRWSPETEYVRPNGERSCRACANEKQADWRKARVSDVVVTMELRVEDAISEPRRRRAA